ncbi:MAG: aldose epimerase family protein [Clostridia bacterium]|nr:aldose epimerase family protein [Clostridia bacterium]
MSIIKKDLFKVGSETLTEYALTNGYCTVKILNYGAIIRSFCVQTEDGLKEIVLHYDSAIDYLNDEYYLGATVGRVCGRIENASFVLDGKTYILDKNDGENCLHGGYNGFNSKFFSAKTVGDSLIVTLFSKNGEGGFPGDITFSVTFSLVNKGLKIKYHAESTENTPFNVTNHTYFNFGDTFNTEVFIDADMVTPVKANLIPEGFLNVENTPFDFRKFKKIGESIDSDNEIIKICNGYDINYVLNGKNFRKVAAAKHDKLQLNVYTDMPAMQFYTGNFLPNNPQKGLKYRGGFCFETQNFPNAVNNSEYPSVIIKKGKVFDSETMFEVVRTEY